MSIKLQNIVPFLEIFVLYIFLSPEMV
jgi:hypothetical protein